MSQSGLAGASSLTRSSSVVYVHHPSPLSHYPLGDPVELRVAPQHVQHSVGAIIWGQEASAGTLFASSEAQNTSDHSGYHVAFDPDQGRRVYEFNAKESGDAMALDPDGSAFPPLSNLTFLETGLTHVFCRRCSTGLMHRRLSRWHAFPETVRRPPKERATSRAGDPIGPFLRRAERLTWLPVGSARRRSEGRQLQSRWTAARGGS